MEQAEEFEAALYKLIAEAKNRLGLTDKTLAYVLIRIGMDYYLRNNVSKELDLKG